MSVNLDRSCPNCGNANHLAKVSLLYQKYKRRTSGVMQGRIGTSIYDPYFYADPPEQDLPPNKLVQKFAPPPMPVTTEMRRTEARVIGCLALLGGLLVTFMLAWFAPQVLGIRMITSLLGVGFTFTFSWLGIIILASLMFQRRRRAAMQTMPRWEQAMNRWDEMYYCPACDAVYVPGEGRAAPVAQMHTLAYNQPIPMPQLAKGEDARWLANKKLAAPTADEMDMELTLVPNPLTGQHHLST